MSRSPSRRSLCAAAIGALAMSALATAPSRAAEDAVIIPAPSADVQAADGMQTAVIAGGLFLGCAGRVPAYRRGHQRAVRLFRRQQGDRHYTVVSSGATGHAEAVEIKYDPKKIGYGKICRSSSRWRTIRPS